MIDHIYIKINKQRGKEIVIYIFITIYLDIIFLKITLFMQIPTILFYDNDSMFLTFIHCYGVYKY